MSKCIKNENGVYVELPRDKIKFESKETELIFDLSLENDELQQENIELKEKFKATNKGLNKVRLKRKKWKYQYYNERNKNKELKDRINKACDLLKLLHYQFPDYDDMHNRIEEIEKILKEDNKEEK